MASFNRITRLFLSSFFSNDILIPGRLKSRINQVEKLPDGTIRKRPGPPFRRGLKIFDPVELLQREVHFLELFRGKRGISQIVAWNSQSLILAYAGEVITHANLPADALEQVEQIAQLLDNASVIHRDIKQENLLVWNGVITLIDFGWAVFSYEKYTSCPREAVKGIDPRLIYDNAFAFKDVISSLRPNT